jgi:SAM-dependent methyltransferase
MESDEKLRWNRKYGEASHASSEPESFLVSAYSEFVADLPPGDALDLAGGAGRHALWLAQRGWKVKLIDISEAGVAQAEEKARNFLSAAPGSVTTQVSDLKYVHTLGVDRYELVLVFFFLQRNLFPALIRVLKPGGFLIYQTYVADQQSLPSGPRDPAYLLNPNELHEAFRSLQILHYREKSCNRATAELVARKEAEESL